MQASILLRFFFQETQPNQGISIWVWALIIIVLILLIAWYLYRSSQRGSTSVERTMERPVERMEPAASAYTAPDDLVIIEGIGPKIAEILVVAGITTFNQLAATDVNRLKEILDKEGLRLADPSSWAEQARLAAAGDQAGLKAYQERLKGGREM
jgi:predicted flap endonuclease-1-like 5' DNA nuclease